MQAGADKIISIKTSLVSNLEAKQKQIESAMQEHVNKVKGLEDSLASTMKSFADAKFDIKLGGMGDAEKFNALMAKGADLVAQMGQIRADVAAKGTAADAEQLKALKALETESISTARAISSLGKDGNDAVISKAQAIAEATKLLNAAEQQATGTQRDSINAELELIKGLGTQIATTKDAITKLKEEITSINELKAEIKLDGGDITKLTETFEKIKEVAREGFDLNVQTEAAKQAVEDLRSKVSVPSESTHTVKGDTSAVDAAIRRLMEPTSSTHTVYVQKVETNATGGLSVTLLRVVLPVGRVSSPGRALKPLMTFPPCFPTVSLLSRLPLFVSGGWTSCTQSTTASCLLLGFPAMQPVVWLVRLFLLPVTPWISTLRWAVPVSRFVLHVTKQLGWLLPLRLWQGLADGFYLVEV